MHICNRRYAITIRNPCSLGILGSATPRKITLKTTSNAPTGSAPAANASRPAVACSISVGLTMSTGTGGNRREPAEPLDHQTLRFIANPQRLGIEEQADHAGHQHQTVQADDAVDEHRRERLRHATAIVAAEIEGLQSISTQHSNPEQ